MTLTLELTLTAQAQLRLKAEQEGQEESVLASRLLSELLAQEYSEQEVHSQDEALKDGTMADLFAGRTGIVSGSSEAYSENGGKRFAKHLAQKHKEASR